jgi:hypothetical protein
MELLLLGITVISLVVALVMSLAAWRLTRDEKRRSAARVAALSVAASPSEDAPSYGGQGRAGAEPVKAPAEKPRAPWAPAPAAVVTVAELPLNQPRVEPVRAIEPSVSHASGFLGATIEQRDSGGRQRSLAFAAVVLFLIMSGGLAWMMSSPEGTSAVAVGPNSPLELVSLSHARQKTRLAVSGLVRNPVSGKPVERLSAVVFLFDRTGTFVTSSTAHVDFLKLGAGDESPFVVSLDAPTTVARYRVSFRTDDGVVPHIDRRGAAVTPAEGEQPVNVTLK